MPQQPDWYQDFVTVKLNQQAMNALLGDINDEWSIFNRVTNLENWRDNEMQKVTEQKEHNKFLINAVCVLVGGMTGTMLEQFVRHYISK